MRALVLEHLESNPSTVYREVLDARGIAVDVVRLDLGAPLPPWRGYDLVVVMGGAMSAFDEADHPWLVAEKALIREVVAAGLPYFGVCLGAQLLADALGGRAYRGPEPELGIHPVVLTEAGAIDPVFGGFPRGISVFEFHQDTFDLPPGAVRLAGSPRFPNQAFRVGTVAYAMQCHLEVTPSELRTWIASWPAISSVLERRRGAGSLDRFVDEYESTVPDLRETGRQLFRRWLENALVWGGQVAAGRSLPARAGADLSRGLAGRAELRGRLESALAAARGGRGSALGLVGEVGIGKSSLLDYAAARAAVSGMAVARACGSPPAADAPFAALSALVAQLDDSRGSGNSAPVAAHHAGAVDRFSLYDAAAAAMVGERPVAILVDDADWLDEPSWEALTYLARRTVGRSVALVAATRDRQRLRGDWVAVPVGPLDDAAARAVMEMTPDGAALEPAVAQQVLTAAHGNPLALLRLPSSMDAPTGGDPPLHDTITAGAALERSYIHRIENLPAATRRAMLLQALADPAAPGVTAAALGQAGLSGADLDPARADGLLVGDRFEHPLAAEIVAYTASEDDRRSAHAVLASVCDDPLAVARHGALAAIGADESSAAALAAAADAAAGRGAWSIAARQGALAARLTPDPRTRGERLVAAASWAHRAGRPATALDHLDDALEGADDDLRGRIELLRGLVAGRLGGALEASRRLVANAAGADGDEAAQMLAAAVIPRLRAGEPAEAVAIARAACAATRPASDAGHAAIVALATALALVGDTAEAAPLAERAADALAGRTAGDLQRDAYVGAALRLVDRPARAREVLEAAVDRARRDGALGALAYPLIRLADLEVEAGAWPRADALLAEAVAVAREVGSGADAGLALGTLAWLAAARGDDVGCRAALAEAEHLADRLGGGSRFAYAGAAEGLLALGEGRLDAAVAALQDTVEERAAGGWSDAAAPPHLAPDLVEALARRGDIALAGRVLERFDADAGRCGRASAIAAAARCHGMLDVGVATSAGAFAVARSHQRDPFGRARTLLAEGRRLSVVGDQAAAGRLTEALAGFRTLGATPWAAQAARALTDAGLDVPVPDLDPLRGLSPGERVVLAGVADGRSLAAVAAGIGLCEGDVAVLLDDARAAVASGSRSRRLDAEPL